MPAAALVLPGNRPDQEGVLPKRRLLGAARSPVSAIPDARLLILGLAPAAHGANRTGRVFTGDGVGASGDFLMAALKRAGFANISTSQRTDDGLQLTDAYIAAAVRCAPPDNKPLPEEIDRCLAHLQNESRAPAALRVVVALGKIAWDAWLKLLALMARRCRARGQPSDTARSWTHDGITLIGAYHPSRQNTNTGVLTPRMYDDIFRSVRRIARSDLKFRASDTLGQPYASRSLSTSSTFGSTTSPTPS